MQKPLNFNYDQFRFPISSSDMGEFISQVIKTPTGYSNIFQWVIIGIKAACFIAFVFVWKHNKDIEFDKAKQQAELDAWHQAQQDVNV